MPELEQLIKDENPDFVGVSEILPKNKKREYYLEEFNLESLGYEMVPHPNLEKNVGRGSLIYIRKGLIFKQHILPKPLEAFEECVAVEIKLNNKAWRTLAVEFSRKPDLTFYSWPTDVSRNSGSTHTMRKNPYG